MIFSSLFSYSQKPKYEIISDDVTHYEFNKNRDKIYIATYEKELFIYDVNTKSISKIAKVKYRCEEMLLDENTNILFCRANKHMYLIYENGIIKTINYISREELNKILIHEIKSLEIFSLTYNIINLKNGTSFYTYEKYVEKIISKEQKKKIKINTLSAKKEPSYKLNIISKKKVISSFENEKIIMKEQSYHCNYFAVIFSIWNPPLPCRYKIKITQGDFKLKLKDKRSRDAYMIKSEGYSGGRLRVKIPESRYITDVNGEIYLPFYNGDNQNLIRIIKK